MCNGGKGVAKQVLGLFGDSLEGDVGQRQRGLTEVERAIALDLILFQTSLQPYHQPVYQGQHQEHTQQVEQRVIPRVSRCDR